MSEGKRPRYVLFAGVNGAGKSTLFRSGLWHAGEGDTQLPRVEWLHRSLEDTGLLDGSDVSAWRQGAI